MITEISKQFGYNDLNNYVNSWKPVEELAWLNDYQDRRFIVELKEEEKEKFDYGWVILKEEKPELELTYNDFKENKILIDKQPRKLFKYINDKSLSETVGKYKLPNKKLYLVISTNFDDFLMCSTNNSWTACTDLKKGDFRQTVIGNIFTEGRFIVYVTDMTPTSYKGLESYKMFFRCFGFINKEEKMITNIWYPVKKYMSIENHNLLTVKETDCKEPKYGFTKVFNDYGVFIYPYLDYSIITDDKNNYIFADDYVRFKPMVEFKKDGSIDYCGDYFKFLPDKDELSYEETLWRKCDICGGYHGKIKTIKDKNYCDECLSKTEITCDCCGGKANNFTEDNTYLCDTCATVHFQRNLLQVHSCIQCGTLIRKKNEIRCKFCRSDKIDAYYNPYYRYIHNDNLYDYTKHCYVDNGKLPTGIKFDEDIFSETEKYVKR